MSEIDTATANSLVRFRQLAKYNRAHSVTIRYNNSDAPDFISIKVPIYKTYNSGSVQLSYVYSPSDAMYESITWSSDNDPLINC